MLTKHGVSQAGLPCCHCCSHSSLASSSLGEHQGRRWTFWTLFLA